MEGVLYIIILWYGLLFVKMAEHYSHFPYHKGDLINKTFAVFAAIPLIPCSVIGITYLMTK